MNADELLIYGPINFCHFNVGWCVMSFPKLSLTREIRTRFIVGIQGHIYSSGQSYLPFLAHHHSPLLIYSDILIELLAHAGISLKVVSHDQI